MNKCTGTRETGSRSSRLFKKLHEARYHRDKNSEARGSAQKSGDGRKGTIAEGLQVDFPSDGPIPPVLPNLMNRGSKVMMKCFYFTLRFWLKMFWLSFTY
jgi:hypothetical protein